MGRRTNSKLLWGSLAGVLVAGALAIAGLVVAASDDAAELGSADTSTSASVPVSDPPVTTTTQAPSTTTTAPPTTTTTEPPPPPPPQYQRGDEGPEVLALQARLVELGYFLPEVDGRYGQLTQQAVMAFQKVEGLARDGVAGPQTLGALETAGRASPRNPSGSHVEIDLQRQVLFVVSNGQSLAFNTSTGRSGWRTPPGSFSVTREIDGMRHAPLGDLWRPKYFNGGIAIHGSNSIPGHPASHGCARLANDAMNFLWDWNLLPKGTPVSVY